MESQCDQESLFVNSLFFLQQAEPGQTILIGDGLLSLLVKEKCKALCVCVCVCVCVHMCMCVCVCVCVVSVQLR